MALKPQYGFNVNLDDLMFILKQIKIAEDTTTADGKINGQALRDAIGSPLLPYGLRTVDGTWNSLLPGMERLGAADNIMPRLIPGVYHNAEGIAANFFGPGSPEVASSSYAQTDRGNLVFDSQPRIISNLIVDQTANNPAAVAAALERAENATFPGMETVHVSPDGTQLIPNHSPDIGLSAPFNGMMALFGQFFDHGLDLISKGGGTVFVPLQVDDPLYVEGSPTNFMVLTRAANTRGPGADGVLGNTDDDLRGHTNTTTPFIDQNQTYTSHPSHQVFLREYKMVEGKPLATGLLIEGAHGIGNWAEVKAQAASLLGIQLQDSDIFNVPLLATDRYGEFLRGPNGFVQIVTSTGLVEGDPQANGGQGVALPINTGRTGHAFLDDIAHAAVPGSYDHDHNPGTPALPLTADSDDATGPVPNPAYDNNLPDSATNAKFLRQATGTYDNELLDRHFITGDGRGNENIGLTAIHNIFHDEHNRLVEDYKLTILASADLDFINEWLVNDISAIPTTEAEIAAMVWDGERLFQAGRFANEMQYQHLVFEEFARAVQPSIDPFVFSNSADIDPAIMEEFANVVYRFGHSMLNDTVDRLDANMRSDDIGLIQAFLNPVEFDKNGTIDPQKAVGEIVRGMSRQVGNEIDEFVTGALRNNLVGLPLDLATLNIARARDTGAPSFNEARAAFYQMSGDSQLKPYTSWADFAPHMKNPASIINFIAAYGTHPTVLAETTVDGKRAAATLLVMGSMDLDGQNGINSDPALVGPGYRLEIAPSDRLDFLNGKGVWLNTETGLNKVDFWIGGLAEAKLEFGGMLAPTFNFVFENQMEKLQNGDRFYYLSRTQGLNMLNELEGNLFSAMVMRNTDIGAEGSTAHLPAHVFTTPSYTLEMDQNKQQTGIDADGDGSGTAMNGDPGRNNPILNAFTSLVTRVAPSDDVDGDGHADGGELIYAYDGADHVVLGGTPGNDTIMGGRGMDTLWGDGGNDILDGGDEADEVHGGDGDDIITDHGTPAGAADFLRGDNGNDVISNGAGNDVVFGGAGQDFFIVGPDFTEVFAGEGNDFILGGNGPDVLLGNEGDDWLEGGEGFDGLSGENSELFFNSAIIGHDVLNGQGNDSDYDGESGDDIMVQGTGIQRNNGMLGFDWATHKGDPVAANSDLGIPIFGQQGQFILRDRFDSVEALSGWKFDDVLVGTVRPTGAAGAGGGVIDAPLSDSMLLQKNVDLIKGLQELLGQLPVTNPEAVVFDPSNGADILIGGAGNDRITGKAGNDLIDGDAWLNVRVSVRSKTDPNLEIRSVDSIAELKEDMLAGRINPGQLRIVREILQSPTTAGEIDQAIYSDLRANYDISRNVDNTWTVAHTRGTTADGIDRIRNIEELVFTDGVVNLTGMPHIDDMSPTEQHVLTATPGTVAAFSGVPESAISYQWQAFIGGAFVNIAGASGASFTPQQGQVGLQLRVVASFRDAGGVDKAIPSEATKGVGDQIIGGTGNDTLAGTGFDDELRGLAGNDVLDGRAGADVLNGASGDDTYIIDDIGDTVVELAGGGTDTVQTTLPSGTLADNLENLTFAGSGDFLGTGNALANTLTGGNGNDTLNGGAGSDRLVGGLGNDAYVVSEAGDVVVEAFAQGHDVVRTGLAAMTLATNVEDLTYVGADSFSGTGNADNNTLTGGVGNDVLDGGSGGDDNLFGLDGSDTLRGGIGDDILEGGLGNDSLDGGVGNDIMRGGGGDDVYVVSAAGDIVTEFGNEGTDTVRSALATYELGEGVENLVFTGTTSAVGIGNALHNELQGNSGNDTLDGGGGVDWMAGGVGNDTYVVDEALDAVVELAGAGTDTVRTTLASYTLIDHVVILTYAGTADFIGQGNGVANTITGGDGNDALDGGAGSDRLVGGIGNDTYVVSETGDVVIELAAQGNDVVRTALASHTLAANTEELVFTGTGNFAGTGNAGDNSLTGGDGNDVLDGGAGNDTMRGGVGDDMYVVSAAGDIIVELGNEGTDTVRSAVSTYVLGEGLENLIFTGTVSAVGTGNAQNNRLQGNSGNDTLDGREGSDWMAGGIGSDTYVVDDVLDNVVELAGAGTDTIRTTLASLTLVDNVEHLTYVGAGSFTGVGNGLANTITGGIGNDMLDGGAGVDRLVGGAGNDTYLVSDTGDVVVELAGQGSDLVRTALASHTLASNVEELVYTGTGDFNGTGNADNNSLTGGSGNDVLDGGLGNDSMRGGAGNDTYVVSATGDIVTELANEGIDTVRSFVSTYVLGNTLENLVFATTVSSVATGNSLNNRLQGNIGNDTLDGRAGADWMAGGLGNDTYVVDEQLDEVVELAGGGTDTIRTTLTSQTLLANVEHLTYTGSANFTGVGNVLANTITAGSGSDTLDGGAGADRLVGGDGNDTYLVDSALDVVVETSSTGGIDLVRASSSSYSLSSNVENLTFVGTGSFSGAGNLSNNIIIGGDGADSLSGGAGNDRLSGGLGNDTYFVDVSTDVVVEAANSGVDTVTSSGTSFTLSENVENLIQTGTGSATLTGNGLDNYLLGNAGANVLRGLEGNDRLEGGKGDDRLEGNAGNDIFVFGTVGFGADTIAGGFDADAAGGQDLLDISGLGITAASFSSTVTFADLGSDLRVTVGSFGSFVLQGVGDPATVNIDDFLLSTGSPPVPGAGPGDIMSVG